MFFFHRSNSRITNNKWLILVLTALFISSPGVVNGCDDCQNDENECWLCGDVGQAPNDWYAILPDGQSCTQYYLYMYDNLQDGTDDW